MSVLNKQFAFDFNFHTDNLPRNKAGKIVVSEQDLDHLVNAHLINMRFVVREVLREEINRLNGEK